jgi:hypothetical protein
MSAGRLFDTDPADGDQLDRELCEQHTALCDRAHVLHERLAEFDRVHRAPLAGDVAADAYHVSLEWVSE